MENKTVKFTVFVATGSGCYVVELGNIGTNVVLINSVLENFTRGDIVAMAKVSYIKKGRCIPKAVDIKKPEALFTTVKIAEILKDECESDITQLDLEGTFEKNLNETIAESNHVRCGFIIAKINMDSFIPFVMGSDEPISLIDAYPKLFDSKKAIPRLG